MATGAVINALWDIWAKMEGKPLWKLLTDMEPEKLLSVIDFRYMSDILSKEEAFELLKKHLQSRKERETEMQSNGYPAYITSCGWAGYSEEKIRTLCRHYKAEGFTRFKAKVGTNRDDDARRLAVMREEIGWDAPLMTDANQIWDVPEAIDWMTSLAEYKPVWIEEPTSPDDIMGHLKISKALKPFGIGVASGEMCQNRVVFKQLLQSGAIQYCQLDATRMGGVNEVLAVMLMAAKLNVPVNPHGGGVGMCELVQHLSIFDYICLSPTLDNKMTEYADQLHNEMVYPVIMKNGCFMPPQSPGYSSEVKSTTLEKYQYPDGVIWRNLIQEGKFKIEGLYASQA